MQNYEHLTHVFDHLNLLPTQQRDSDITRLRFWALENMADRFRQTVFLSSFSTPELARLWRTRALNAAGKRLISKPRSGSIINVIPKISQVRR